MPLNYSGLATHPGFEPGTSSLTVKRSTAELMCINIWRRQRDSNSKDFYIRLLSRRLPYHQTISPYYVWKKALDSNQIAERLQSVQQTVSYNCMIYFPLDETVGFEPARNVIPLVSNTSVFTISPLTHFYCIYIWWNVSGSNR